MAEGSWQRSEDWVSQTIEDSTVLLDISSGVYYALNETSSAIWEGLANPVTADDIVAILQSIYAVGSEDCRAAVERTLTDFDTKGLARKIG